MLSDILLLVKINFLPDKKKKKKKSSRDRFHDNTKSMTSSKNLKKDDFPYVPAYINNGYERFFDPNGSPEIKPTWGTLNAINLNTDDYFQTVPLGEFPELTKKGGIIVTVGGGLAAYE